MSKATRPPNARESSLHYAALSGPNNEISAKETEEVIPDPTQRKDALNYLLSVGLLKPLKSSKGVLSFRAVTKSEHTTSLGLTEEEKVVLGNIRAVQNEGIWKKHLNSKTNFHRAVLDRCLKTLEQKKLIKTVPSVQHPTRKIYMLEGLVPSVTLTGGPWFTDGEFDTEFIQTLMKACLKFIRDISFPKSRARKSDGAVYPISKSPKYPTAQQVKNALKQARLTETDLTVEHVEILLNVLVLDGELEKLPAFGTSLWDSGAVDDDNSDDERRSKKKRKHHSSDNEDDDEASSSKRRKNRKTSFADSDSDQDTTSSKKKPKRKRLARSDESENNSSEDEVTYKKKSKDKKRQKTREFSGSDSGSDSDNGHSRSKSRSRKRSPSPFFSFDEVGSTVYKAIREERVSLGLSQAPCSTCPSFDFCKNGGPVNPAECVYYHDWLGGGVVAAIEDAP
ncbi:RNA polymerase Rpc34 [Rhodocollybia butyracea]|uniref:RNA polymerase Rpc34 n=1 Tax=Rhodocollybia butyracea TaxID=206335 RepID=A0A9P5UEN4_9AGAR|nr:RNA polymerase Rpc34 [Rhodocollybia butyracea]